MTLITIWLLVGFECNGCTDYIDRALFAESTSAVYGIFIYCWISVILSPMILTILLLYEIFKDGATTSRDLQQMIDSNNYDGILEIQLYAEQYGVYDQNKGKILLALALEHDRNSIVSYLMSKRNKNVWPLDESVDLLQYFLNDPDLLSKHLSNIYRINPLLFTNIADHYLKNPSLLTTKDLLYIEKKQPQLINKLFLGAVGADNQEYFVKVMKKMPDKITLFTDSNGRGINHYVALGGHKHLNTFSSVFFNMQ